jgi:uncharacterized protein YjgD (DUF1641 family)
MAEPTDDYPAAATRGGRERATGDGEAALREALDVHGEELAAAIERSDEVADLFETAILTVATADEAEIENVTEGAANLIRAADGLSTAGAAALAEDVGDSGEDLAEALELLLELQREGHLDDLVDLAKTLSAIEVDDEAVEGLNTVLGAIGEAERENEPVGMLGMVRGLRSRDARAGLGYLLAVLRAQGRRVRGE